MSYAAKNGADIISMSYGGRSGISSMQNMINSYPDTLRVAAAGNDNSSRKFYPCAYDNVYCVAASSCGDQKASFSNFGEHVDITAPGTNILSTYPSNTYRKLN